ncbi:MAG: hypothetical protein ABR540_17930 [Acidimicrobiales bacterium]
MKKGLLIALVVLVVLTGIPLVVAMPAMACQDCGPAMVVKGSGCAALLVAFSLFVLFAWELLRSRRERGLGLLLALGLERPPRLA